jgi:hypothetical protein
MLPAMHRRDGPPERETHTKGEYLVMRLLLPALISL